MSETENFLKESGEAFGPIAGETFKAVIASLNTLCGGAITCGEPAVAAGSRESLPQGLSGPLVAAVCEATGRVAGAFALVVDMTAARGMTALMLGGTAPPEGAETLGPDEQDAFKELAANAASAAGSALRSRLSCETSVALKSVEAPAPPEKLGVLLGGEAVFVSAQGTVGGRETAILLACSEGMCRAAAAAAAPAAPAEKAPPPADRAEETRPAAEEPELPPSLKRILKIRVPVIVVLAEKVLSFKQVLDMTEGSVIEFDKNSAEPLRLLVNDKKVGLGVVVKAGERFGLRIEEIGDPEEIVKKL